MSSLIIYGGTFDPLHVGHIDCVSFAHQFKPEARIYVIPAEAPVSFQEKAGVKTPFFSFAERFSFLQEVFAEMPFVFVSDIEKTLPVPSYTINTVEKILEQEKPDQLFLLIGFDQWRQFHRWHQVTKLLSLCDILVVPRKTLNIEKDLSLIDELNLLSIGYTKFSSYEYEMETGKKVYLLCGTTTDISGQEVREALAKNNQDVLNSVPLRIRDKLKKRIAK